MSVEFREELHKRETTGPIGSDKIEGAGVFRPTGEKIGTIVPVMIDKRTGTVAYAVMSFGGFLGIGEEHYPIPWQLLAYDEELGRYEADISELQLKGAPKFHSETHWAFDDRAEEGAFHQYYGTTPHWR